MTDDRVSGIARVTVALDPVDVDLLDRLAVLADSNRSAELRGILAQVRPTLLATVEAFEGAKRARGDLDRAAAAATVEQLAALVPRAERIEQEMLGALASLEGADAADPRRSNHGGHNPDPPTPTTAS